ncbi:MAG: LysR family transcriptional regulator [Alphaproteobacteria bacterium]|nr:LysR family transcriptional regulator [Alphaproteobacteria bacterium]
MSEQSDNLENWNEVHTAYHVARLGTLSAAATYLGVHHATVIRHIDALEARLGSKLFQRHARGYTPTEAGRDMMRVAAATEDQLTQLAGRLRGQSDSVSGELVVTTLSGLSPQFTPLLVEFQQQYPDIRLTFIGEERTLRLEHGEAHVAIRAGAKPQEPDAVVQRLMTLPVSLFAHKDYVARFGPLKGVKDIANHRFVLSRAQVRRAPFHDWTMKNLPEEAVFYRATDMRSLEDAVHSGAGIGVLSLWSGQSNPDLVQMAPSQPDWDTVLWLVTHVALHRSAKVQAFLAFIKDGVKGRFEVEARVAKGLV